MGNSRSLGRSPSRGSILVGAVLLMAIAGLAVVSWLLFINDSQRLAARSRAQVPAFYAAEAGVERVVDFFNNPENYTGAEPRDYDDEALHPNTYPLRYPVYPSAYTYFEPYILDYAKNANGLPIDALDRIIWDTNANRLIEGQRPLVTRFTYFANLRAGTPTAVSLTSKVITADLDLSGDDSLVFRDRNGREISRVVSIRMIHPADLDADELALATNSRPIVAKVVSVGEARGVRVTVESLLTELQSPNFASPAAIISESGISWGGNFNVAWGEVWSKEGWDMSDINNKKLPRLSDRYREGQNFPEDPWFRFRTEGVFYNSTGGTTTYADGRVDGGYAATMVSKLSNPTVYEVPYHPDHLHARNKNTFKGLNNLIQNQSLVFPTYDYEQWREFFLEYDLPYFWTDVNGNIYGRDRDPNSNTYGQIVSRSYDGWFNVAPSDPNYHTYDRQFAFIDSVPTDAAGNPAPFVNGAPLIDAVYFPKKIGTAGARAPTVKVAGSSTHSRGVMLANVNMDLTGQGSPPSHTALVDADGNRFVRMPDGNLPPNNVSFNVFHNGLMFSWGQIAGGGNRTFYGSIYAVGGYGSQGNPTVYYNARMKDGSWLPVTQSRVRRSLWNLKKGEAATP